MSDFGTFYHNGGVFMHVITITAAIALTAVLLHGRTQRMGAPEPKLMQLAERMAWLGLALGVVGSVFGFFDLCAALSMVDPGTVDAVWLIQAAARGAGMVPIPTGWALMCGVPIWLVTTIQRTRKRAAAST